MIKLYSQYIFNASSILKFIDSDNFSFNKIGPSRGISETFHHAEKPGKPRLLISWPRINKNHFNLCKSLIIYKIHGYNIKSYRE
jgi:hypothetical protein